MQLLKITLVFLIVAGFKSNAQMSCPPGKVFSYCGLDYNCDNYPTLDPWRCQMGCFCPDGSVLESSNSTKCISKNDCPNPPICPKNEEYQNSGPDNICNSYYEPSSFAGCHCKDGFIRVDRTCILPNQCKQCRGEHQYLDPRPYDIQRTCKNYLYYDYLNTSIISTPKCVCRIGYYWDEVAKKCALPKDCSKEPSCFDKNEKYSKNGTHSDCFDYANGETFISYTPGCYCREGYIRDVIGSFPRKCIPLTECSCGPNQHIDYSSIKRTCDNRGTSQFDPSVPERRCQCDYGYFLVNANSTKCIVADDCPNPPKCNSVNETFKLSAPDHSCPKNVYGSYDEFRVETKSTDCYCKDGYVRNYEGSVNPGPVPCIKIEDCPVLQCIGNLTYKISSRDKSCANLQNATRDSTTWIDCFCKDGYVRHPNGYQCILPKDCLTCGDNQETKKYGCQDTCETWREDGCLSSSEDHSCTCKTGYIFKSSDNKTCIPIENCPKPVKCGENKIYKPTGTDKDCSGNDVTSGFFSSGPGCYCKDGFVKTNSVLNTCKSASTCPNCTNEYEEAIFTETCRVSCEDLFTITPSLTNINGCPNKTKHLTCGCKFGYALESKNSSKCIPYGECRRICGPNQEYKEIGVFLDCNALRTNKTVHWNEGPNCYCKKGYVMEDGNIYKCKPASECIICKANEEYKKDGPVTEDTCANWAILKSTFIDYGSSGLPDNNTKEGCFCKEGFFRDSKNSCVPKKNCPYPPRCPVNQEFKRSGFERFCENSTLKTEKVDRCYCKSGFVRNYRNECVLPYKCPRCESSDRNSIFSPCVHCFDNCDGTRKCSWKCLSDCDCKPGYVFNSGGKCVLENSCFKG